MDYTPKRSPFPSQRKKLGATRHVFTHAALRESLRAHGQFVPVFVLGGVIVDGARRDRMMRELGRTPRQIQLHDHREAARVLWALHPWHALEEYCDGLSLTAAADLLGVTLADIATIRGHVNPRQPVSREKLPGWRPDYKRRWDACRRYLSKVRQGTVPLSVGGIEEALRLPPFGHHQ